MKNKNWTRPEIQNKLNNALYACDIISVKSKNNGDIPLALDSFDWYNLWEHLEHEFGAEMNCDPKDGLTTKSNVTMNDIVDFLYDNMNVQTQIKQIDQKKSLFRDGLYSKTKERY